MKHANFYDRAYFDGTGKSNYCSYNGESSPFAQHADAIAATLREYLLDGPVLDIGCAKGYLVAELRRRGIDAHGVDWSPYAVAEADPDVRPFLNRAGAHDLPFADGHFALAVSFDVLEHMDLGYARRALKEIGRISDRQLHQVNTGRHRDLRRRRTDLQDGGHAFVFRGGQFQPLESPYGEPGLLNRDCVDPARKSQYLKGARRISERFLADASLGVGDGNGSARDRRAARVAHGTENRSFSSSLRRDG